MPFTIKYLKKQKLLKKARKRFINIPPILFQISNWKKQKNNS